MKTTHMVLAAAALLCSQGARAVTGDGYFPYQYQNLTDWDTQFVSIDFWTGTAGANFDNGMHFAIGLMGDSYPSWPSGRGIVIGSMSQEHTEVCLDGVMVEDFTGGGLLVAGTCNSLGLKANTHYRAEVHVSYSNVFWRIHERQWEPGLGYYYIQVGEGGCMETAGVWCPKHVNDTGHGDVFIAAVWTDGGTWSFQAPYITHW